jgi:hypothetical protein
MSDSDPFLTPRDIESETLALARLLSARNNPSGTPTSPENQIMYLPPSFSRILAYRPFMSPIADSTPTPITAPHTHIPLATPSTVIHIHPRSDTPTSSPISEPGVYILPEIEVKRAQSLLLALVLSLAVLTAITIIFTYFRHRAKIARNEIGRGDVESLEYVSFPQRLAI